MNNIKGLNFSPQQLQDSVASGRVTARPHPTLPYTIYNYGPQVQFSSDWDEITLTCRGLILDPDYNIIARPWKKFFNLGQVNLPIQFDDPVEVTEKYDGSLGILYPAEGGLAIATRGSFASEQAIHATAVWNEKYAGKVIPFEGYTLLFEILYPGNRIVLDYQGQDDLVLLGAVNNETGYYVGPREAEYLWLSPHPFGWDYGVWPGPVATVFEYKSISEANAHMGRAGSEGFVIRSGNFMVKLKEPDYLDLHKLVTNITPKNVWLQLKDGKSVSQICEIMPDEFHGYVRSIAEPLIARYDQRLMEILAGFQKAHRPSQGVSRKAFAQSIAGQKDKKYFFLLLDNRPVRDVLWGELQPREAQNEVDDS